MGFVINRSAKLVCDKCSKEVETSKSSQRYGFMQLNIGECYQSGKGAYQDYELINQKERF